MNSSPLSLPILGWREYADLPDWGVHHLRCKIDTGARTSALHVEHLVREADGSLTFDLILRESPHRRAVRVHAPEVRVSKVKPKPGLLEERPVVRTRLRIGDQEWPAEFSLVERQGMLCRALLGRRAFEGRFLVDASARYLHRRVGP